jgi:hypothetical protein
LSNHSTVQIIYTTADENCQQFFEIFRKCLQVYRNSATIKLVLYVLFYLYLKNAEGGLDNDDDLHDHALCSALLCSALLCSALPGE